ncbi:MAG: enoyl-CoA hydratase/isomerase family protein [Solirubrobacteraceae bacterium]
MPVVETEDRAAVRHVVLNRPEKRNAFNEALIVELGEAMRAAADDRDVRVVVLRGAGPAFSSGIDLSALSASMRSLRSFRREWIEVCNLMEEMAKPVVCQIHGTCIGGALETALACDMRVIARDAAVGLPETRVGLIPDVGGCSRLPAMVGVGRAKELIMTGRLIGGDEAERIGLANRSARLEELEAVTGELVGELLACAPIAVGLAKRIIDSAAKPALAQTLEQEVTAQQVCAASEDYAEGARALRAKRQPEFANR